MDQSSRICTIVMQDLMKRGVCQCRCGGGDALRYACAKADGRDRHPLALDSME
jgi:hypothetical protein